jgi:hypothetical protein
MIFNWSAFVINGFISSIILLILIFYSVIKFVKNRERTQLYLILLFFFYLLWIFFQSLFTLLLNKTLFLYLGSYSMIGILIFVVIFGDHVIRGKLDWRKIPFLLLIIVVFVVTTYNTEYLTISPIDPSDGELFLESTGSTYGMGYNIIFMSFSFAFFYYMAVIKIHWSQNKKISNYVIIGGIVLGLLPHLLSIVFSGISPFVLGIIPPMFGGPIQRILYFPGFEFLVISLGALIITYTFKLETKLNQAYNLIKQSDY